MAGLGIALFLFGLMLSSYTFTTNFKNSVNEESRLNVRGFGNICILLGLILPWISPEV